MYSQNKEDEIVARYFGDYVGTLLDVGANDGITFSNSRYLIEKGWKGTMVEPSQYGYEALLKLYNYGSDDIMICHCAIGNEDSFSVIMESGAHVLNGKDRALVSTLVKSEMERWRNVEFKEVTVKVVTFESLIKHHQYKHFDFITIDAEGYDLDILRQIDLTDVGCKCLCIEWNSKPELANAYMDYCAKFGLKEIHRNAENIIFCI
jgi:FkbM family methyltransferase